MIYTVNDSCGVAYKWDVFYVATLYIYKEGNLHVYRV